jgi:hypothetical protein
MSDLPNGQAGVKAAFVRRSAGDPKILPSIRRGITIKHRGVRPIARRYYQPVSKMLFSLYSNLSQLIR